MKTGNSVKVKEGIISPDYDDLVIGGWQGRVREINDDIITINLDSKTITSLSEEYVIDSLEEGFEFSEIMLFKNELDVVESRDSIADVEKAKNMIEMKYSIDDQERRISKLLQTSDETVDMKNLGVYIKFLRANFPKSYLLTGAECFAWEEPYLFGYMTEAEYEKEKKTKPVSEDVFKFISFDDEYYDEKGIMTKIKRESDNKIFHIAFWDLVAIDEEETENFIISDYSYWMTNYR